MKYNEYALSVKIRRKITIFINRIFNLYIFDISNYKLENICGIDFIDSRDKKKYIFINRKFFIKFEI